MSWWVLVPLAWISAPEDYALRVDETAAEDVERRGVIGTETE